MTENFPVIRNFYDIFAKSAELIAAVEKYPALDVVYYLSNPNPGKINNQGKFAPFPQEVKDYKFEWCIAGSSALHHLTGVLTCFAERKKLSHSGNCKVEAVNQVCRATGLLPGDLNPDDYLNFISMNLGQLKLSDSAVKELTKDFVPTPCGPEATAKMIIKKIISGGTKKIFHGNFEPGDVDIFFLNSPFPHRLFLNGSDLVMSKAKSVDELLINFDIPCCRAAYNVRRDYWVSAQCLYSMMMGKYPMPTYTMDPLRFGKLILEHRNGDPLDQGQEFLITRFAERTKKYKERGFAPYYFETDRVLEWVKGRFHYGSKEWDAK